MTLDITGEVDVDGDHALEDCLGATGWASVFVSPSRDLEANGQQR